MADRLAIIQSEESIREFDAIIAKGREVVSLFKDVEKSAKDVNKALNSGRPRAYAEAISNLANVTQQYANIERGLAATMARTANLEAQQARAARDQAIARRENAAAAREEGRVREQAARQAANEARNNDNSTSAYRRLVREMQQVRQRARDYQAELFNLSRRLREGSISQNEYNRRLQEFQRNARATTQEAARLQAEIRRINQSTIPSGQRNGALLGRVTDIIKGISVANILQNVASSFFNLGKSAYDTAVKLETLRLAQYSVFKTNQEVARQNEFLTGIAQRYGVEILSLTDSYTKFQASAAGTTLEGKKAQDIFDALTRSSALLGVSGDDTNGILRALGQMMSKGKVQAEELRGQLGDRMAGAFKLFADGMGVSTAQLDQMLKKGEVLAEDVLPKFAAQLNKKYTLGFGDEIETKQAALTRLTNAWTIFVEAVENRSNIVGSSISNVTALVTGLLKELTPSNEVTIIQQQQVEFNKLGILLRQNWDDTKKRKDLIDQMIAINPNFLDGLDREKATLEQITDRLRQTNEQYVQKIILQKYEDQLNEILEEQAERIGLIAKAYADNAEQLNNLTLAQQKVIQSYTDGNITYNKAADTLKGMTGDFNKANGVLFAMGQVIEHNTINSKGYISTTKSLNRQGQELTTQYNDQLKIIDRLAKSNGNLLGINTTLIGSNYLLGNSYDFLSQKQALVDRKRTEDYNKTIKQARELKQIYTSFDGFFFDTRNGKNTGKRVGEYDIVGDKLVKRLPQTLPEKVEKPKAASLTAAQKDQMNILQAERDTAIAYLTQSQNEGLINEHQFQEKRIKIIKDYAGKVASYLKGNNAKEKQVEGSVILKASTEIKAALKDQFEYFSKQTEETYRKTKNVTERQAKDLESNDYISNSDRLNKQIDLDNQALDEATKFYNDQIDLAKTFHQDTLELERKRDEEIGKIQDTRFDHYKAINDALKKDLEKQTEFANTFADLNYEEQRAVILADKKLSIEEQSRQLDILEKTHQIELNKAKIKELEALKTELKTRIAIAKVSGVVNPDDVEKLAAAEGEQTGLKNTNISLNDDIKNNYSKQTIAIRDQITSGLTNLGFGQVADNFTLMFDRIMKKTADWKDYTVLASTAVFEGLSMLADRQKEKRISALDEELKASQATNEQELGFINNRLEQLNNMEDLSKEQLAERNKLEQEARGMKEQQLQREKMIATQKAKAEQKAAAQQALINGALAATQTLAQLGFVLGAIPAALALGFGVAQSIAIMSKDPVPQYWKGTMNAKAGLAWRDEKGGEIHTDKNDNLKAIGDNKGPKLVKMEAGDKVYTASKTKAMLKRLGRMPKIGENIFKNSAMKSMIAPVIINNYSKNEDNSKAIVVEVAKQVEAATMKAFSMHSNPYIVKKKGLIIEYNGSKNPIILGEYDLQTLAETYFTED